MNAKDLKTGDMIKLHKATLDRLSLFTSYIGLVECKAGAKIVVWFFNHGKTKIRRKTIGANTAVAHVMKDDTKMYHQKMLLSKYFEDGLSNEAKEKEINFK